MYNYYVYAYLRESDNTPYYIGKGKGLRAYQDHVHVNIPKDKNKIVIWQDCLSEKDAYRLEISYIKLFGRKNNNTGILINSTSGGEGGDTRNGKKHSVETIEEMKKSALGRAVSEEVKEKIRNTLKGNVRSIESRLKQSLSISGSNHHLYGKAGTRGNLGKKHTEEAKRKMSETKKKNKLLRGSVA